ncbi:polysaccharide lyase [Vreelandella arctica]|uniref:polysaccharide lyase n=1 Tax=Vreelandella arctica TaxID=3126499 RepID=UPI00300E4E03
MKPALKGKQHHPRIGLRHKSLLLSVLALLPFAASNAGEAEDAVVSIPQVAPCSQRYSLAEAPSPAPAEDAYSAVRQGFNTTRHWGAEENVERLAANDTGINEAGLRVHYPAGSSSPSDEPLGGAGFYSDPSSLQEADRACLSYKVRFPADFDFVKGGKLPGLYGGEAPSGGESVDGENGFSMRLMWREEGEGELYPYVVDFEGASVGRGFWRYPTGSWVTIEQEIMLNDPKRENGVARIWVDGQPVLEQKNIVFRTTPEVTIDGLMFSTFFGGTGEGWRTPRDQYVDFADFRFYTSRS